MRRRVDFLGRTVIGTALFGKDVVVPVVTLLPLYGSGGNCVRDGVQFCLCGSLDGVGVVLFSRGLWGIRLASHCFSPSLVLVHALCQGSRQKNIPRST
jgi:hypothetical protein